MNSDITTWQHVVCVMAFGAEGGQVSLDQDLCSIHCTLYHHTGREYKSNHWRNAMVPHLSTYDAILSYCTTQMKNPGSPSGPQPLLPKAIEGFIMLGSSSVLKASKTPQPRG